MRLGHVNILRPKNRGLRKFEKIEKNADVPLGILKVVFPFLSFFHVFLILCFKGPLWEPFSQVSTKSLKKRGQETIKTVKNADF